MTDIWNMIKENINFEERVAYYTKQKQSMSYFKSMYWSKYLKLVINSPIQVYNENFERNMLKIIICEIIYMAWIKRKLNSRKFNMILFNPDYLGGYISKQKIKKYFKK